MSAIMIREETERAMAAWALTQVDVPWVHQGRSPGKALDCVGLGVCAARACSLPIEDLLTYSEQPSASQLLECIHRNCEQVDAPVVGGLVVFWIRRQEACVHAGMPISATEFVHALRSITDPKLSRVRRDDLSDGFWQRHLHSLWRYKWAG